MREEAEKIYKEAEEIKNKIEESRETASVAEPASIISKVGEYGGGRTVR